MEGRLEARGFMAKHYYHMFANGDDATDFITTENEFKAALNRIAVCAHLSNVTILAASIEDTHPHILMWASEAEAMEFKDAYRFQSIRYIARRRGSSQGVKLNCELCRIDDESYLMNAASYVIVQATKDGKPILPYDYLYGTGALYFRRPGTILPWDHDFEGHLYPQTELGSLPLQEQWAICNTKLPMPGKWIVANGIIHPKSYVDIAAFERIFKTHNCFRAFMASGKNRDEIIRKTMSSIRGITIDDIEARKLCHLKCLELFSKTTTRHLTTDQRLTLALEMRKHYSLSTRQLASLTKIPEIELMKYVK